MSRGELLLGSLVERRGLQRSFWGERELLCGFFLERVWSLREEPRGVTEKRKVLFRGAAREIPGAAEEDGLAREGGCLLRLGWRYFLGRETFEERFFWTVAAQNIQRRKRLSGLVTMVVTYVFILHAFHTYLILLDFQFRLLGCFGLELFWFNI